MSSKSKTLKIYFVQAILLSALVPFIFSVWLLWSILQSSNEKIKVANDHLEQSSLLQLIDTFHKVQSAAYMVATSEGLNLYFQSTIDNEHTHKKLLEGVIQSARNALCYKDTRWVIYGSRGKALLQIPTQNFYPTQMPNINKDSGIRINSNRTEVEFIFPISYQFNPISKKLTNNLGYIYIILPISEIKKQFPNLVHIYKVSSSLDIKDFKVYFKLDSQKMNNLYFIYVYIFIILLLLSVAIYWGVKVFQKRIVDKLLSLRARVLNEMNYADKRKINNELDSLSITFEFYLKYTSFLQSEIRKSSQLAAVGNLAHSIAHDVRRPFSTLYFFLQEIKGCNQIKQVTYLAKEFEPAFTESKNYIEHLLNEVMDAGISKLNISEKIKFEDLLFKSFLTIGSIKDNKKIEIEYQFAHSYYMDIDEIRILRVILNILANAIEAIHENGRIWIHTEDIKVENENFVEISIGNSNSFIEKEHLQSIFEPFFTRNKEKGTGLGLSIAQKIIKLHKGNIECFSEYDKGVEFIFFLPANKESYIPHISKLPKRFIGNKIKVALPKNSSENSMFVLIDDDPLVGRSWKRYLNNVDFMVFLSPEEFFNYANKNENFIKNISIIVTDYYFGVNSEYEFFVFARSLRDIYFNKIFLSSDAQINDYKILDELGIIKIDKRPHSIKELLSLI
ncbi:sensor histidine kinase [Fluviispira multicolorata]|uniref:histidine kinase n=1 Tax=Fluviispira multicolorata TaxID=2654512 RepID=A0A833N0P6_9BACT|nr:HAMP domain-containing sensor histidine kinase [Fluviispira multicolorata]KAB8029121.1 GHKL domain-containing protein [Fluviispira multicolorata]